MALCLGPTKTNFGNVAHFNSKNARLVRMASMTAKEVALQGYRAFRGGRVVAVSGWRNKLLVLLVRLLPRLFVRRTAKKFNGF
jgi:short-subunit dehydrogenase